MTNLPENWVETTLSDVVDIYDSERKPVNSSEREKRISGKEKSELYPYYGATGQVGYIDNYIFDDEFVLLGEDGAPFLEFLAKKAFIVRGKFWVNNHAHILKSKTNNKFLCFFLNQFDYHNFVTGTTRYKLTQSDMCKIPIPLPPLAEQGRIVQKIEELFADIDAGIQNLKSIQDQIKLYRQSVLKSAFEGNLTNEWREENLPRKIKNDLTVENTPFYIPSNWTWFKLPQIGTVERGKSKHRPRNDKRLFGGKYPFIQTGEIKASKQYLYDYSETYSDFGLSQSRLWDENTLCITIAANIAETAILKIKACFPDSVVGFTKNDLISRIEYVEYYMRLIRENLDKAAPATAQKNINLQTLSEVLIPVPTLDEQERIVAEIEKRFERADELEKAVEAALADAEKMKQAILKKAFRGELVEQNPDDEPAAVLLDRIRAERAAAPKSSKKGRRK